MNRIMSYHHNSDDPCKSYKSIIQYDTKTDGLFSLHEQDEQIDDLDIE
jgi:hypothetical protein